MDVEYDVQTYTAGTALATTVAALAASSGVPLDKGYGAAAVARAVAGNLTAGNIRCYVFMPFGVTRADNTLPVPTAEWMKYPLLDFPVNTGVPATPSGDKWVLTGVGRIIWVPDVDVTVSSGTTLTVLTLSRRGSAGSLP